MPGFPRLVESISDAYRTRRGEVLQSINQLMGHSGAVGTPAPIAGPAY